MPQERFHAFCRENCNSLKAPAWSLSEADRFVRNKKQTPNFVSDGVGVTRGRISDSELHAAPLHSCRYWRLHAPATKSHDPVRDS